MKYKYRLSLYFVQFLSVEFAVVLILYGMGVPVDKDPVETIGSLLLFLVVFAFIELKEYKNKYVETFDEYMCLNSFRFRGHRSPFSPNVRYEDIWYIEARRLPIIGVWGIRINAKFLPHKVTISYCFKNSSQLYAELCEKARLFKPDVYIDDRLTEYLNK